MRYSLRTKILLLIAGMVTGLGLLLFWALTFLANWQIDLAVRNDVHSTGGVLATLIQKNSTALRDQSLLLARQPAFRYLIHPISGPRSDWATFTDAERSWIKQLHADAAQITDANGQLLGDTDAKAPSAFRPAADSGILLALRGENATRVVARNGKLMLAVSVPIVDPVSKVVQGTFTTYSVIDAKDARELKAALGCDVAFLDHGMVVGASLPLPAHISTPDGAAQTMRIGSTPYVALYAPLPYTKLGDGMGFVVLRSHNEAMAVYQWFRFDLIGVCALALMLALGGAAAVAFNSMAVSLQQSHDDLREAESQLVQSAKLASLGTLSAGVAHELNQPVAIIRGLAQQLRSEPGLASETLSDLEIIEGQTSRMMKIINHMRSFCHVGRNEIAPVDVNQVAKDCFILIGEQLRAHNIAVEMTLCEEAPPVLADANELEQVVLNLVTNARDALEGRPQATIHLRSWHEAGQFHLEVRDNGPGIPDDLVTRVFDPFFTTKEPGKGTGLGLSISHSIIRKYRGALHVNNDNGAVFTITLPLASAEERSQARAA